MSRSGRVLQHQVTDAGERSLDVLDRAAADRTVRLDDRGPTGGRSAGVGHREQGLRHLLAALGQVVAELRAPGGAEVRPERLDPKSTRLNSSHANISYAVFCLKKKKKPRFASP